MTAFETAAPTAARPGRRTTPVLLFDLGNIVNAFVGFPEIQRLWQPARSIPEIRSAWIASPAVIDHEIGRIDAETFGRTFVEEWELPVSPESFLALFMSWVLPPFPGIFELLDGLKARYPTACLSNTSAYHWTRIGGEFGFDGYFDRQYLSFRMGLVKPEPAIYRAVVADLAVAPNEILFFDDTPENVEAARAAGIPAHQVEGAEGLRAKCLELGLL